MQTFASRSCLLASVVLAAVLFFVPDLPAVAQSTDTSPAAQAFEPDAATPSAINGCGKATNIGSSNVAQLYVDGFPCDQADFPTANEPYTNVKICQPGSTTNCQIIDHVLVDSGSDGLRFVASAIKSTLLSKLPSVTVSSKPVTECETYVDSYTYGPLKAADVYIAGKVVKNFPMQMIGASGFPVPTDCANQAGPGSVETQTTSAFNGNGLVGVAFTLVDTGVYYTCATNGKSCVEYKSYPGIPNLTSKFSSDNNGVVITLPTVPVAGSSTAVFGSLIFGVGTETNNKPPSGTTALVNQVAGGTFNVKLGSTKATAYIDSGTNDLVATDSALPKCKDNTDTPYYCPTKNTAISMGVSSYNKTTAAFQMGYTVANADSLQNSTNVAYRSLTEAVSANSTSGANVFAMGLTTFFGRTMYFVFNSKSSSLGTGPINAMSPQD